MHFSVLFYQYQKKSGSEDNGSGKGKKMFTAIRSSYLYLESIKKPALDHKEEWGLSVVCSDKNKLAMLDYRSR